MSKEPLLIHVYNALTGEQTQREITPEEVAQNEATVTDAPVVPDPD
jgi:hypothetical protein